MQEETGRIDRVNGQALNRSAPIVALGELLRYAIEDGIEKHGHAVKDFSGGRH